MPRLNDTDWVAEAEKVLKAICDNHDKWRFRVAINNHQLLVTMLHPLADRDASTRHVIRLDQLESSGLPFLERSLSELDRRFPSVIEEEKRRELKQSIKKQEREKKKAEAKK